MDDDECWEECRERQEAELEFVESAYAPEEARCERHHKGPPSSTQPPSGWVAAVVATAPTILRRLELCETNAKERTPHTCVRLSLRLTLPREYPVRNALGVEVLSLDREGHPGGATRNPLLRRAAWRAIPALQAACREVAEACAGAESVFVVLSRADDWIRDEWPALWRAQQQQQQNPKRCDLSSQPSTSLPSEPTEVVLGRRVIHSHHIISKTKRSDISSLAALYDLTGYMKIGWPGLLIVEGREEDCLAFWDEIRPWKWQYLVVRGEQQERILNRLGAGNQSGGENAVETVPSLLQPHRKFHGFVEVDDTSLVARHCREVGLEALFRTCLKVYDDDGGAAGTTNHNTPWYGALVHVDHMNHPKAYRKWLRRTGRETSCRLVIKQTTRGSRPKIVVGVLGDSRATVGGFLKRWRTQKVDVDATGKPCCERQMSVVAEGSLGSNSSSMETVDWTQSSSEECVDLSEETMAAYLQSVGGTEWKEAWWNSIVGRKESESSPK